MDTKKEKLNIVYVPIVELKPASYNARKWSKEATEQLCESIKRFGISDPLIVNSFPARKGTVIGGNFRLSCIKKMGFKEVPVVFINISDIKKEQELNIRLNRGGEFDWNLLANFDEAFLKDIGFSSEELDGVFGMDETPEVFDLEKELAKLDITKITVKTGEVYDLNGSRLMIGNSTVESDVLKLMDGHKADMCFTDPPYLLDYLKGKKKRNGKDRKSVV